jgi:hypothetical protein
MTTLNFGRFAPEFSIQQIITALTPLQFLKNLTLVQHSELSDEVFQFPAFLT